MREATLAMRDRLKGLAAAHGYNIKLRTGKAGLFIVAMNSKTNCKAFQVQAPITSIYETVFTELERINAIRPVAEVRHCSDCQTVEGALHEFGCDFERCPFCGGQLISCNCASRFFYPEFDDRNTGAPRFESIVPFCGLPEEVYNSGLSDAQHRQWRARLTHKGRVPYILYPNICGRCGEVWPRFFRVPNEEWEFYIELRERDLILCLACYLGIRQLINAHTHRKKPASAMETPQWLL